MLPPVPPVLSVIFYLVQSAADIYAFLNDKDDTRYSSRELAALSSYLLVLLFTMAVLVRATDVNNPVEENNKEDSEEENAQEWENVHEKRLSEAGYKGPIPHEFRDPISWEVMVNPVTLMTGHRSVSHSFEQTSIDDLMKSGNNRCPFTGKVYTGYVLNLGLKAAIEIWVSEVVTKLDESAVHTLPRDVAKARLMKMGLQFSLFNEKLASGMLKPRKETATIVYRSNTI